MNIINDTAGGGTGAGVTSSSAIGVRLSDPKDQVSLDEIASSMFFGSFTAYALRRFPLLEELNLYLLDISKEGIEALGNYCPMLKTLKLNCCSHVRDTNEKSQKHTDDIAIAIGQNLIELRHLELIGNKMTNVGLQAILDNCHCLETLDLRACFNIVLNGDLEMKCFKQIKSLKLPHYSLEGCPYIYETDDESSDEDYHNFGANNDGHDSSESYDEPF